MRGKDKNDDTSFDLPPEKGRAGDKNRKFRIGVLSPDAVAKAVAAGIKAASGEAADAADVIVKAAKLEDETAEGFRKAQEGFKKLGCALENVEITSLKYGVPAYYTIATAEASANLARFDTIRYGARPDWAENPDDLIDKGRQSGFGPEVKLRILLGTFVLRSGFQDQYYNRAQRIRGAIRANFERYVGSGTETGKFDAILMPVFPRRAFSHTGGDGLSPLAQKAADLYTCCANLAGLPALSFPASLEGGLPVGVQLLGASGSENLLLDIAGRYLDGYPVPHPEGWKNFWA
jgi:aspartyl-tRNA(Asn)/glutamyl-tRNA(Gln) amidotransferase subunit A